MRGLLGLPPEKSKLGAVKRTAVSNLRNRDSKFANICRKSGG